jgi:hypothetical protein
MINRWMRKQAAQCNCSPALALAGCLIAMGIACYVYREVILQTIAAAFAITVAAGAIGAVVAIAVSTVRWYGRQPKPAQAEAQVIQASVVTEDDAAAISREADWLANGVELAFSPDGKTLVMKDK